MDVGHANQCYEEILSNKNGVEMRPVSCQAKRVSAKLSVRIPMNTLYYGDNLIF
jgi:hypothetical protein